MSREPLEPLDPELANLLDAERRALPPAASLKRVWSRVEQGPLPGGGAKGSHGTGSGWLASHALPLAAGTFLAGTIAGAAGYAALRPAPAERIVYLDRVAPPASIATTIEPPEAPQPTASPPPIPSDHPSTRQAAPLASTSTLVAERALLDDARAALASGDTARALTLLDVHANRFPKPQLAEEHEALAIQALVVSKRYDEARSRAARFRAAAPNSLFLPAIDASLASIP